MEIHAVRVRALKHAVAKFPTISAFAKHYAIDGTYISQLLHGHRNMGEKAARNIESKLKLPFGTLDYEPDVGEEAALEAESHRTTNSEPEGRRHFAHEAVPKIPLISFVQAGVWREAVNSHRDGGAEDYLHSQVPQGKDAFALTVRGASMQPEFEALNCKLLGLSIDSTYSHIAWLRTIKEKIEYKGMKGVEVNFPAFGDGRGYSSARLLREAGYAGELRAVGDLPVDELPALRRCGFDAFAPQTPLNQVDAEAAFNRWPDVYQATTDGRVPIWALRHGKTNG